MLISGAAQSVVSRQDLTSKATGSFDVCYYLSNYLLQLFASSQIQGYRVAVNTKGQSFMVKCESIRKSTHPPLWWTCKMLHQWVLFHEAMVFLAT